MTKLTNLCRFSSITLLQIVCMICITCAETQQEYFQRRSTLLKTETKERTGGDLVLNVEETAVNKYLMKLKLQEIYKAEQSSDGATFPPSMHFFKAKPLIEKSQVFQFIRAMPKGAALHLHDTSMVSTEWLIKNVTYRDYLYMCASRRKGLQLKFAKAPPKPMDCKWGLVTEARKNSSSPEEFDEYLERQMTIIVDDPAKEHVNQSLIWTKFYAAFAVFNGALCYDRVFVDYYFRALQEYYEDNVQYFEFRSVMPQIYSIDGSLHDQTWFLSTVQNATNQFVKTHPDFMGAKMINSILRMSPDIDVLSAIKDTVILKKKFPNFVIGFDLVGQEDPGRPLVADIKALLYPSQQNIDLKFYFHAGETDWGGEAVDINIIDALLLNTSRIGHGYAILKHPEALRLAREKSVPLEVNPISNQVLGLVEDLRNHPVTSLLATGFPLVVSADDPGVWGAKGVSYDWYEIFMGPGGSWADLATLKKLALDSIRYSGLSDSDKQKGLHLWTKKWNAFIKRMLKIMT